MSEKSTPCVPKTVLIQNMKVKLTNVWCEFEHRIFIFYQFFYMFRNYIKSTISQDIVNNLKYLESIWKILWSKKISFDCSNSNLRQSFWGQRKNIICLGTSAAYRFLEIGTWLLQCLSFLDRRAARNCSPHQSYV